MSIGNGLGERMRTTLTILRESNWNINIEIATNSLGVGMVQCHLSLGVCLINTSLIKT